MKLKCKKNEKGFTLIELIIVIVILGIIAGVAVPKFIGLSAEARISSARGVGGAISGTIQSSHAAYLISATAYDADTVLADTNFSGGVTVANAANVLTFVSGPSTFTWTYNPRVNDVGAYITELAGF